MTKYYLPFEPGAFYHVFNRGNNGDDLFYLPANYPYFLQKLAEFVGGCIDVYSYALLPNHFHFLIKTKSTHDVLNCRSQASQPPPLSGDYAATVSEFFRRFFLCYANAIKKQEGRSGSLFEKNFKRILINSDRHLLWLINYIHRNPETHGIVRDYRTYRYSSYRTIVSAAPTKLKRHEVISLFGSLEEFIRFHETNPVVKDAEAVQLE